MKISFNAGFFDLVFHMHVHVSLSDNCGASHMSRLRECMIAALAGVVWECLTILGARPAKPLPAHHGSWAIIRIFLVCVKMLKIIKIHNHPPQILKSRVH